jgi:hypothetical protein
MAHANRCIMVEGATVFPPDEPMMKHEGSVDCHLIATTSSLQLLSLFVDIPS